MRSVQNYFYFEPASHAYYWLVPSYRGLILQTTELPKRKYDEERKPAAVVVYELVDRDTDGDGKLTINDSKTIATSDPAGKHFVRLLQNVNELNGSHLTNSNILTLMYTAGEALHAAEIDVASGKLVRESLIKTAMQ